MRVKLSDVKPRSGAAGIIGAMNARQIPIHPVSGRSGCTGCASSGDGPVCRSTLGEACQAPVLSGPDTELQRLLHGLGQRLGFAPDSPEQGGVRALRLGDGEAELHLALPPGCQSLERAEAAFDTLRRLLPDTDIYVSRVA